MSGDSPRVSRFLRVPLETLGRPGTATGLSVSLTRWTASSERRRQRARSGRCRCSTCDTISTAGLGSVPGPDPTRPSWTRDGWVNEAKGLRGRMLSQSLTGNLVLHPKKVGWALLIPLSRWRNRGLTCERQNAKANQAHTLSPAPAAPGTLSEMHTCSSLPALISQKPCGWGPAVCFNKTCRWVILVPAKV